MKLSMANAEKISDITWNKHLITEGSLLTKTDEFIINICRDGYTKAETRESAELIANEITLLDPSVKVDIVVKKELYGKKVRFWCATIKCPLEK